jgi:hypothetical protein
MNTLQIAQKKARATLVHMGKQLISKATIPMTKKAEHIIEKIAVSDALLSRAAMKAESVAKTLKDPGEKLVKEIQALKFRGIETIDPEYVKIDKVKLS